MKSNIKCSKCGSRVVSHGDELLCLRCADGGEFEGKKTKKLDHADKNQSSDGGKCQLMRVCESQNCEYCLNHSQFEPQKSGYASCSSVVDYGECNMQQSNDVGNGAQVLQLKLREFNETVELLESVLRTEVKTWVH